MSSDTSSSNWNEGRSRRRSGATSRESGFASRISAAPLAASASNPAPRPPRTCGCRTPPATPNVPGTTACWTATGSRSPSSHLCRTSGTLEHWTPGGHRITGVQAGRVHYTTTDAPDRRRYYQLGADQHAFLQVGEAFRKHQVIAGHVAPLSPDQRRCEQGCDHQRIEQMLGSRERTSRFTGCKLARLTRIEPVADLIRDLARDAEEDTYVRMEARSYLCSVLGESADSWFRKTLFEHPENQMRLESAVALAETQTPSAFELLRLLLEDRQQPTFLRSACAWAIGCHGTDEAAECLVRAFADVGPGIRGEALAALENLGASHFDALLAGLGDDSNDIAAGSAEAIRRIQAVPGPRLREIVEIAERGGSTWPAWTLAHLRRDEVRPYIAALQNRRPDIHYALSVLWTFLESWVSEDWTPRWTA